MRTTAMGLPCCTVSLPSHAAPATPEEPPGEIQLVHGEPEGQKALKSQLDTLF